MRPEYRSKCADRLRANDAAVKTECCLRVLAAGREHRQRSHEPPRVYACHGLTRAMKAELGWTYLELSHVMRVMRADLALWSIHTWDEELVAEFREAASLFLRVHRHRNWKILRSPNDIVNAAWDQHTIHGFYFALYAVGGSITRASWLPYELDVLRSFYVRQHELGDPLTPLDREVLAGAVTLSPTASVLSRMVRAHVGVGYDEDCVTTHRHLLVTGSPKPVQAPGGGRPVRVGEERDGRKAGGALGLEDSATNQGTARPRRRRGPQRSVLSHNPQLLPLLRDALGLTTVGPVLERDP